MYSCPSHSLRGGINHSLSYSHFNRVPMPQGNRGKKLFAQGEPGRHREKFEFCLISENFCRFPEKIQEMFFGIFIFMLFKQTTIFLRMDLICFCLAKTP